MQVDNNNMNMNMNMNNNNDMNETLIVEEEILENENAQEYDNLSMEEIYEKLRIYSFACEDLALYLDTHPNDLDVLQRQSMYSGLLAEANNSYERFNNPIDNLHTSSGYWTYVNGPWPLDTTLYSNEEE